MSQKIKIMFYCLGNICRSPLAEALFRHKVEAKGLAKYFHIESAGTSAYHEGEAPHPGSQQVARERLGMDISDQSSQPLTAEHVRQFDYLIAMDQSNLSNGQALGQGRFHLLREFEAGGIGKQRDVPDPWGYGPEQFEYVYELIDQCTENLLDSIISEHGLV